MKERVRHAMCRVIGGVFYTQCGIYVDYVTANPDEVTCQRCLKTKALKGHVPKLVAKIMES